MSFTSANDVPVEQLKLTLQSGSQHLSSLELSLSNMIDDALKRGRRANVKDAKLLSVTVALTAIRALESPLRIVDGSVQDVRPLKLAVRLIKAGVEVPSSTLIDLIISFPYHASLIRQRILDRLRRQDETRWRTLLDQVANIALPEIIQTLTDPSQVLQSSSILLSLCRVHLNFANAALKIESSLSTLSDAYTSLSRSSSKRGRVETIAIKSKILLILQSILSTLPRPEQEWKLAMLSDSSSSVSSRPLVNASLAEDYAVFFGATNGASSATVIGEEEMDVLRSLHSGNRIDVDTPKASGNTGLTEKQKALVAPVVSLFPALSEQMVYDALSHPQFKAPSTTASDSTPSTTSVELLTNALLDGSIPADLADLRQAMGLSIPHESENMASGSTPRQKPFKRENVWNDVPLDVSRLKIGKDESHLSELTASVPDHIRSSILALTQRQLEEEEAELEAEREEAAARRARRSARVATQEVGFEEELDDSDAGDATGERAALRVRDGAEESEDEAEDVVNRGDLSAQLVDDGDSVDSDDPETICERMYLISPGVFDRNSRKSNQREDLKKRTGWTDEQVEGWRSMLERNPRKDKILARHQGLRPKVLAGSSGNTGSNASKSQNHLHPGGDFRGRAGHRGGHGRGGGRGGGGGGGGGGSRSGGGGGGDRGGRGGRGSANKSLRGHQNAARTRGHDRKMQRMGAA